MQAWEYALELRAELEEWWASPKGRSFGKRWHHLRHGDTALKRQAMDMAEEGFPMELSVVDFKDPVGNAAWREHTRAQGRGPMEMPLMETEDDLLSRLEAV